MISKPSIAILSVMLLWCIFVALIVVTIFEQVARGENVPVRVIYAPGHSRQAICPAFAAEVVRQAGDVLQAAGVALTVRRVVTRHNKNPARRPVSYWLKRLRSMPDAVTLVITPPLRKQGNTFLAGWGLPSSYGFAALAVAKCGPSIRSCVVIAAHEIAHTLGATHTRGACNLMRYDALGCPYAAALRVTDETREQIAAYLGGL